MYASVIPAPGVDKMSPEPSGLYDLVIYKGETEYPRHEVWKSLPSCLLALAGLMQRQELQLPQRQFNRYIWILPEFLGFFLLTADSHFIYLFSLLHPVVPEA